MNSAKAVLKKDPKKDKKKKPVKREGGGLSAGKKIAIGAAAVVLVLACVLVGMEQLKRDVALTVNGTKVYYDEMMYYVFMTETQMSYTNQMYLASTGQSFWDQAGEDGTSNQSSGKESIRKQIEQTEILYQEAKKAGYKLTEEDKTAAKEALDYTWEILSADQIKQAKFTKDCVRKLNEKMQLAQRYKNDRIDSFAIDDDAIKAGFDYNEYRQYDVEYYFAPFSKTDGEGKEEKLNEEGKENIRKEIDGLRKKAETAEEFDKLIGEDEETAITFKKQSFTLQESDTAFDADLKKQLSALGNNALTEVITQDDGYYFFKMINNDSTESYDKAVEQAITEKENEVFTEEYDKIYPNYTIEANQKVWDSLVMGRLVSSQTN